MSVTIWCVATLIVLSVLIYHRVSLLSFAAGTALMLAIGAALEFFSWVPWLIAGIILLPLLLTPIRKSFITSPILKVFRKIMPEMSETESDALEAGTVW